MVKQVQAGIAPGNSRVVWDRLGYTPEEQRLMGQEVAAQRAAQRAALMSAPGRNPEISDGVIGEVPGGLLADTP